MLFLFCLKFFESIDFTMLASGFIKSKNARLKEVITIGRLSNKDKSSLGDFFTNDDGKIEFNKKCMRCKNECKQSYRATIVCCPKYIRR